MNDEELKRRLEFLPPPPINEAARGRALHRAVIALARTAEAAPEPKANAWWRASITWAAACAVVLFAGLVLMRSIEPAEDFNEGADARTLAQVEALFPGRLNAVIEHDGDVRLDLAGEVSSAGTDQPVLVQLEGGGRRLRVLSYSGRSVVIELDGARFTFEALVTGDGGVVLSGEDFAWSSAQPKSLAGYHIQARALTAL